MTNSATTPNPQPSTPTPHSLLPLLGYFLLTIIMTWPTILYLTTGIPGDGFDGWQNYWNLWWSKEATLVLQTHPYFTDYLYPPGGTNLLFHTLNIFNFMWTLPLQLNFGLAVAYNSVVFFSFVFAGYGGYLLSLYTLKRMNLPGRAGLRLAAFVGGVVFTMAPFHLAHLLGHMQVFSMVWPPFYVLWLLRLLKPWASTPPTRYAPRDIILTCLFLILAALVDWYHMLYLLIFTALVVGWIVVRYLISRNTPNILRPIGMVLLIGLGFTLILSPLLIPMMREAAARPDLDTGLAQNIILSADLLAFVTPSEMHPLWGHWAATIAQNFTTTTSERLIFAGFVPLVLGLFILIRAWRSLIVRFWALVILTFFLLALGPYLHVMGNIVTLGGRPLPLPYLLLYHTVPFIDLTRSLSRYDLMVMLGLGVLVSISLAWLQNKISNFRSPIPNLKITCALPLLALVLICFEFLVIPYPISLIDTPRFFYNIAQDPDDYVIAELPMNWDRPTPMLHQTTHGKRLLTAYTSRDHPSDLARRTPVFQQWRYLGPDIINLPPAEIAPTIFADYNLRYIVLDYWQMPPGPERDATEQGVAAALPGAAPVYDDGRLKVYAAPRAADPQPYLSLADGWSDRETNESGYLIRKMAVTPDTPSQLHLHHPPKQPPALEITAASESPQTLTLLVDGHPVGRLAVTRTFTPQSIQLPPLEAEIVDLKFEADTGAGPVAVRRLSLRGAECAVCQQ